MRKNDWAEPRSWGMKADRVKAALELGISPSEVRLQEQDLERAVSKYIGGMPFLWLDVPDAAGSISKRAVIERQSIALLSNFDRAVIDKPSSAWLGQHSARERVCRSGLWNNNYVDEVYDPQFLDDLHTLIRVMSEVS